MFCDLYDKYGKDFNWYMIPFTQADGAFVAELNKEIGQGHFLSGKKIRAVAKCDSNDDVLYVVCPDFQPEDSLLKHFFRQIKKKEN